MPLLIVVLQSHELPVHVNSKEKTLSKTVFFRPTLVSLSPDLINNNILKILLKNAF